MVLGATMTRDGMLSASSLRRALHGHPALPPRAGALASSSWGRGTTRGRSQAEARAALALECGIPPEAILTGEEMWTTRDEAAGVKALLAPKGVRRILLVTGALHMRRARWLFERAGFEVIPAPLPDASCESIGPEARLGLTMSLAQELLARAYNRSSPAPADDRGGLRPHGGGGQHRHRVLVRGAAGWAGRRARWARPSARPSSAWAPSSCSAS